MSQFNFTAEDLIDKEAIARLVKAKTEESITSSIIYQVSDMVRTHAVAALNESIKEIVEAQKAQILAGVVEGLPGIAKAISEALLANAIENLNGWQGKDILKKLIG